MQSILSQFVIIVTLLVARQGALAAHFARQIDTSLLPALTTAIESVLNSASSAASATATSTNVSGAILTIPECSEKCFTTAIENDGCGSDDIRCHCSKEGQLRDTINPCLVSNCAPQDRADFDHAIAIVCGNASSAGAKPTNYAVTTALSIAATNTTRPGAYVAFVGNITTIGGSSTVGSSSNSSTTTTDTGPSSITTVTATSSPSETGIESSTSIGLAVIHAQGGVFTDIVLFIVGWALFIL